MSCQRSECHNPRILNFTGKVNDMFACGLRNKAYDGYVPRDLGIGGDDYIKMTICLNCGQVQGQFPLPPSKLETDE